jgi:Big-like domain-containing protein/VCBS repeat protein
MTANPSLKSSPCLLSPLCTTLITLLPSAAIAQTQPPLFPIPSTLPIGAVSTPAIGDFNGDGQPDLIYSSSTAAGGGQFATLTVLLNRGAANPTPIVTSSLTCTSVTSLMVADMNNDKKLDVALTCTEGFVAILFGNGDGTFQKPLYYAVSGAQALITPTDLNRDGYLDIVVSTQPGPVVLLNQGSSDPGVLAAPTTFPGVPQTTFTLIGVGDFNGDGKPDILAGGTRFALYLGNGDGTFQPPQNPSVPAGASSPVIADLNHDGISDVVYITADPSPGITQTVQVLLGNSNGQFTVGSSLSLDPSTNYTSLALAGTTNNNGININIALGGPATTILLGDGKGGFTVGQTYAITGNPLQETAGNGNTNLVFFTSTGITQIPGNGDGTFQALPNLPVGPTGVNAESGAFPTGFVVADVNGDGLADVLSISSTGNLVTALGRGNGTFSITDQIPATPNEFLLAGDFNADGNTDIVAILPGTSFQGVTSNSQLFFYKGNGDGSFQPASAPVDLQSMGALHAFTGDFNSDGHLDVVISTYATAPNQGQAGQALIFIPGNGDGSFATPVMFSNLTSFDAPSSLFSADLNNDKKLDLIWNSSIYLGNGDGTFRQQPLGLLGTPLAVGDLNGDGIPDLVIVGGSTPGATVYAGNGDGTFQTTPFYTTMAPPQSTTPAQLQPTQTTSALIGDVNADGHPDLLLQSQTSNLAAVVSLNLGDGKGNFIADPNTYAAGNTIQAASAMSSPMATFARLNNQAPALPNDNALDYLTFTSFGATSLLNQLNPPPTAPALVQSRTTLAISAATANINQQLMLTASVAGVHPTGTVTFVSGNTTLGTAPLTSGTATISVSFAAVAAYSILANYSGDNANLPSTSNTLSITITIPDFALTADRITQLVNRGQPVTTTVTIAPLGYTGTVNLSCTALPAETSCAFTPSSLSPSSGVASTATVTITTTAPTAASANSQPHSLPNPLPPILWAGIVGAALSPKRRWRNSLRRSLFSLVLLGSLLTLTACSSSPASPAAPPNPGTPTGIQSITVTGADSAGGPSHSISLQLTVQ